MTPSSTLLRQLFPSWEFFDVARLPPSLEIRLLPAAGASDGWLAVVHPSPRRWWHVLFNPGGTETLAAQTLVERWYTELVDHGEHADAIHTSFRLVTALAERELSPSAGHDGWQLRLVVTDDEVGAMDIVFESDRLALPAARGTS